MAENPLSRLIANRHVRILSIVLLAQATLLYAFSRKEILPLSRPLAEFPSDLGQWRLTREGVIEKEVQEVLQADDAITREYSNPQTGDVAGLYIAYFQSQRAGKAPHSPKNCLPGSGWIPSTSEEMNIRVDGVDKPVNVNRYVVTKGEAKSVVLYWYQSRDRAIASEYTAKMFVVLDAMRYNRTDTSLVRVIVPVQNNQVEPATETAKQFVNSFFLTLRQYLPA
jgi:EpsI family protein